MVINNLLNFFRLKITNSQGKPFLLLPIAVCYFLETNSIASAQIVPDTTLPTNSIVTPSGNIRTITDGTTIGNNLFHSFEQFSILTGNTAFFNNALTIENIITRVTGGSISNIDGLIQANGTANLFLLNPNGFIFGSNASLNIGGSFISSTADSIQFTDGSEFSAIDPQAPPILTVSVPFGLQYSSNPGSILVEGSGNNLALNPVTFAIIRTNRSPGLQVPDGKTLALLGGDINLQGGNLTSAGGTIELWSVNNSQVSVVNNNGQLKIEEQGTVNFSDIQLSQAASVDTSANAGGNIQVQGRRVTLTEGSVILADTLGNGSGGTLNVEASELLEITGISSIGTIFSGLFTDVAVGASGTGGSLTITTPILKVADGAQIGANTFGPGNAGNLNVEAQQIEITGISIFGPSGLSAAVAPGASGQGGNLIVNTNSLRLLEGAQIFTSTFSGGDAGTLTVKATTIEAIGISTEGSKRLLYCG